MSLPSEIYEKIYDTAKKDPNIIGFFLVGSRGRGFHTKHSDYDVYIIVGDNVTQVYKERYPKLKYEGIDLMVFSYTEFANYASWGSAYAWDRYTFSHISTLIDKNGR
ncbi:MAG: nucleotidyltransferase domain-containing protein, partial [Promethearchaeota archaeon]